MGIFLVRETSRSFLSEMNILTFWQIVIILMMIAFKSCARKGGKERGSMEECGGMRRGMLTRERCNPVSNMLHYVSKGLNGDWAREV